MALHVFSSGVQYAGSASVFVGEMGIAVHFLFPSLISAFFLADLLDSSVLLTVGDSTTADFALLPSPTASMLPLPPPPTDARLLGGSSVVGK